MHCTMEHVRIGWWDMRMAAVKRHVGKPEDPLALTVDMGALTQQQCSWTAL